MRHRNAGRKLGRNPSHRLALKRNLAVALFLHERIITTVEKAKEVRPFVEKLITLAKRGTLHARRLARARLGSTVTTRTLDEEGEHTGDAVLKKLFDDIGPRFHDRPGGYTRIVKRHERRLGDAGRTAFLELLKAGETKVRSRAPAPPPAPAPKVRAPEPVPPKLETSEPPPAATQPDS